MTERIINIYPNHNEESTAIFFKVKAKLEEQGFLVSTEGDPRAELNICIGGDGAFLRSVHHSNFSDIPFVGINTGHLGFYQEILIPSIDQFIDSYIHEEYRVESLRLLSAKIVSNVDVEEFYALNEFVVKADNSSIIKLDVFIDQNHLETFAGDALLISTPSGSTAYNFSAGGSILYQSLRGYQLTPLAPINSKAYRSLQNPIVIPDCSTLKIKINENFNDPVLVIADGMLHHFEHPDHIVFELSEKSISKLVFDKNWYWVNIKDKFL